MSLLQNPNPRKTAIICYDLKNAQDNDNQKVKSALLKQLKNTHTTLPKNLFSISSFDNKQLPDTTLLCSIEDTTISAEQIEKEVAHVIRQQGAEVDKIFVAFLIMSDQSDHYLINE